MDDDVEAETKKVELILRRAHVPALHGVPVE